MPTYAAMAALYPDMETVIGVRIMKKLRLDTKVWLNDTDTWYAVVSEPTEVYECELTGGDIVRYAEAATWASCNASPGSWWYDDTNSRLYVQTTGTDDPSGAGVYYIYGTYPERVATDEVEIDGAPYQGLLQSAQIPDVSSEIPGLQKGGMTQSFGQIAINNDGHYDADLYDYIYEAAEVDCFMVGIARGITSDTLTMWTGWTGRNEWTDLQIFISVEDLRKAVP